MKRGRKQKMNSIWRWILFTVLLCACSLPGEDGNRLPGGIGEEYGKVYIDSIEVLVMESYPMQVAMEVRGNLPNACHELRWEVSQPSEGNEIHVRIYSVSEVESVCTQILAPFIVRIPLGDFTEYGYSVWVNDQRVGGF
jgi:hypothetical protein